MACAHRAVTYVTQTHSCPHHWCFGHRAITVKKCTSCHTVMSRVASACSKCAVALTAAVVAAIVLAPFGI